MHLWQLRVNLARVFQRQLTAGQGPLRLWCATQSHQRVVVRHRARSGQRFAVARSSTAVLHELNLRAPARLRMSTYDFQLFCAAREALDTGSDLRSLREQISVRSRHSGITHYMGIAKSRC